MTWPPFIFGRLPTELDDVLSRRALLALHDVELHAVAFGEALEAFGLDRRMMDEAVLLAAFRGNEAKPLGVVEPLDRPCGAHCFLLLQHCVSRSTELPHRPTTCVA